MNDCKIMDKLPTVEEYNWIRAQVGWGIYQEDVIKKALPNSLYGVCAYHDGKLIGMARVIGDNGLVFYIQDVIILPKYQRQGIGKQLMDKVMEFIHKNVSHNTIIGLMSSKGKESFYERYGFTNRPTEKLGSGMTIFWDKNTNRF